MSQDKPVLDRAKELMTCFYLSQGFMEAPEWEQLGKDFQQGFLGLAALDRQGWINVPEIPTHEMIEAGYRAIGGPAGIYLAMLAALPPAPQQQEDRQINEPPQEKPTRSPYDLNGLKEYPGE